MRVEHDGAVATSHTPDSRYAACSCGWEADTTHYGPLADAWARGDLNRHLDDRAALAAAQAAHRRPEPP